MKTYALLSALVATVSAIAFFTSAAGTAEAAPPQAQTDAPLIVAELFTSQSCSSCPPAEALFSDLAEQDNLLTIEWHVDYWDSLIHGGSKWKDPYSDKTFTERQRSYNDSIRGTRAVYTPQAVVNGGLEGVGNRSGEVSAVLTEAEALPLSVQIQDNIVTVGPNEAGVQVLFVRLLERHETNVKGGENKGRKLYGKNIALDAEVLGTTGSAATQFDIPSVGAGETCAVLVQSLSGDVGPVLGAAKCG